nr:mast cell protease 1A [Oryctolagus cuniculus]
MHPLLLLLAFLLCLRAEAGKIIGGHEAIPHSRPYMAFLQIKTLFQKITCGGFLVREDFVLTAAHCRGSSMKVILGAHNIKERESSQQVIPVKRAIPHPNYQRKKPHLNDIMLLQLKKKANLTDKVSLLRLPTKTAQVTPGMVCSVAGWGSTGVKKTTVKLHEVEVKIQTDQECMFYFKSYYNESVHICVGDHNINKSSSQGDSGGPLVCNDVAQGIVSFAKQDGTPPRVYTKISSFMRWIEETMRSFKLQGPD